MIAKIIPLTRLPPFTISKGVRKEISFFDYKVPKELEEKIKFGQLVKVYFRNKKINGLVIGFKKTSKERELKSIVKIVFEESLITKNQLKLIKWLSYFYLASLATVLKTSLPEITKKVFPDIYQPKFSSQELKIPKKFWPNLKKIINIFISSKRKKFLLLWDEPLKKMAFYYLVIKKILAKNQKVLILLPQIEQIKFILKYLAKLTDKISILQSGLKKSEIWLNWQKILNDEAEIVIGTRMAIFAPIKNLGLVILEDEENELYHSEQFPYYDARAIAWKSAKLNKTKLIFSSLAPRTEIYYYTFCQKRFLPLDLREKKEIRVKIVDMKEEMRKGNFSPLSDDLKEEILNTIKNGKMVLLYLKRKGFSTFNFCQDCGYLFSCPRCNLPLVAHKKNKIYYLLCHHCGYEEELPLKCPNCQGVEIKMKGLAIQKIEEILYPLGKVKRIDALTRPDDEFKKNTSEIIITTFPFWQNYNEDNWIEKVGLVGVINADVLLNQADFRSSEKTFQEIVSIVNWANYFKISLIIQTWSKDNPAIENACLLDLNNFYQKELEIRKEFSYPPFIRLFKLTFQEKSLEKLKKISEDFEKKIDKLKNQNIKIFPYPSPPHRKKIFEKSYLIKIKNLHPLSPLPEKVKKIFSQNLFLTPF